MSRPRTWCEFAGVDNCQFCQRHLFSVRCPNYPKPPKGLSLRQLDDLPAFGPDWWDKPVGVSWPTIDALVKRGVIEKKAARGRGWLFRRATGAPP